MKVIALYVAPTLIVSEHGVAMNYASMLRTRKLAMKMEPGSLNAKLDVIFVKNSSVIFKRTM